MCTAVPLTIPLLSPHVESNPEEQALMSALFGPLQYNLKVRPARSADERVVVRVGMMLTSFVGLVRVGAHTHTPILNTHTHTHTHTHIKHTHTHARIQHTHTCIKHKHIYILDTHLNPHTPTYIRRTQVHIYYTYVSTYITHTHTHTYTH